MTSFLTEKELAQHLKCSVPAIRVWRREKGMPTLHFGRLVRFELPTVLAWFADREPKRGEGGRDEEAQGGHAPQMAG